MFSENIDVFLTTFFGDNYDKELSMENGVKLSSLHRNIFHLKREINILVDRLENDENYHSHSFIIDIRQIMRKHFHISENIEFNVNDLQIIEDIKAYKFELMQVATVCYKNNIKAGWWTCLETGEPLNRNRKEIIALIISEIFEALEGERKSSLDKHLPHRKMTEVELADAVIRIMDYAGRYQMDFLSDFLIKTANKEDKTVFDVAYEVSNYMPNSDEYFKKINTLEDDLKEENILLTSSMLAQLDGYKNFCQDKTTISSIENKYEALLVIVNNFAKISDMKLSNDLDCQTFDDKEEEKLITLGLSMIFDYASSNGYDIIGAMAEKLVYNKNRSDHKKENRLKDTGKKV